MDMRKAIDAMAAGREISEDSISHILTVEGRDMDYLFHTADEIRQQICGDVIHVRGIIEFSSYCRCACLYCGLQAGNEKLLRYRMPPQEIVATAQEAIAAGYRTLVLQAGEDLWYDKTILSSIINDLSACEAAITLGVGERRLDEYQAWKEAGADRYLIKHETADEALYNRLHPHSSFANRLKCMRQIQELGYQLGSGFMVGLPGQTNRTLAKDIMLLKELDVDMAGIGPFIAHPQTELAGSCSGDPMLTIKCVAIARIALKRVHLPATTALGVRGAEYKKSAFAAGANVIMLKLEPHEYRALYDIYPKSLGPIKTIAEERKQLEEYVTSVGRQVADDNGDAIRL